MSDVERAFKVFCPERTEWQLVRSTTELADKLGVPVQEVPDYFLTKVTINGISVSEIRVIVPDAD